MCHPIPWCPSIASVSGGAPWIAAMKSAPPGSRNTSDCESRTSHSDPSCCIRSIPRFQLAATPMLSVVLSTRTVASNRAGHIDVMHVWYHGR